MPTPYAQYVGDRDPLDVLRESLEAFRRVHAAISSQRWEAASAPGKWTLRQIMVHVTQWEMIFGVRLRCALAVPGYVVQPLDQDPFIYEADAVDADVAFAAFESMRRMNLALAGSLTPSQRTHVVHHPERGAIDVEDLLITLAGHAVHHLNQLQNAVASTTSAAS